MKTRLSVIVRKKGDNSAMTFKLDLTYDGHEEKDAALLELQRYIETNDFERVVDIPSWNRAELGDDLTVARIE